MTQQEKARVKAKEWYWLNKERALARIKINNSTQEAKRKKREYDKSYKILNREKIEEKLAKWYRKHEQFAKNKSRVWKQKNPERSQYNRYIERAKKKSSDFVIDYGFFLKIIKMPCVYCGFNEGTIGIDRIDSNKGYEENNIVPCCKICNYMKLNYSLEDWFTAMLSIFENLGYVITSSTKDDYKK